MGNGDDDNDGRRRLTGEDLRLLRVNRHLRSTDLGRHWPCSSQRVLSVELNSRPSPYATAKYIAALEAAEAERAER